MATFRDLWLSGSNKEVNRGIHEYCQRISQHGEPAMYRVILLSAVAAVLFIFAHNAQAQTWGEYQVERRQIIERTNRQMRNRAAMGYIINRSINQLQNHYGQRSGWQNHNNYNSGYSQYNSGYNQSNTYYYNNQPSNGYWKQQSWGQPQVYYRSW